MVHNYDKGFFQKIRKHPTFCEDLLSQTARIFDSDPLKSYSSTNLRLILAAVCFCFSQRIRSSSSH